MEWITTVIEFRDKGKLAEFASGKPFEMNHLQVHDHQTLETRYVKAIVCREPANLPDGEVLHLKDYDESMLPIKGRIKILEELPTLYSSYE